MFSDMTIYVHTNRPLQLQKTLSWLSPEVLEDVVVVCPTENVEKFELMGYTAQATEAKGLQRIRQELLETCPTKYLMFLDDDLRFSVRRGDDRTKFLNPDKGSSYITEMFRAFREALNLHPFAGIAFRSGANRETDQYRFCSRICAAWGFDVELAREEGFRVDRVPLMEDFDFHLQWLTAGYQSIIVNDYTWDTVIESNTQGGCSTYRTDELQRQCAEWMAETWPRFVKVARRPGWGNAEEERYDVTVQWKKAFKEGLL